MSEVQKLKQAHTTARRLFTRAKNNLSRAIHTGIESDVQLQIIENRFTDLRKAWSAVQEKLDSTFSSLMKQMLIKFSQKRNGWQKLIHTEAQKLDYIRERENA